MGTNDPLPPPPPPGHEPHVPPVPAWAPAPQPPPPPFQPPPSFGQPPPPPAPPPPKRRTGLIIGIVVAAIAAVVVGVILLTGGDDDDPPGTLSGDDTVATVAPAPASTAPETTVVETTPIDSFVITAPESTTPESTTPDDTFPTDGTLIDVTDDSNTFVVQVPDFLETRTDPFDFDGLAVAQVSASSDLTKFFAGDPTVFAFVAMAVAADQAGAPDQFLARFDVSAICATKDVRTDVPTTQGSASVTLYGGCGPEADSAAAFIVTVQPESNALLAVVLQTPGAADDELQDIVVSVIESIRLL